MLDQNRALWDQLRIRRGMQALEKSFFGRILRLIPNVYNKQVAGPGNEISACWQQPKNVLCWWLDRGQGSMRMKQTVVRYKVKSEKAEENARLIEKVFEELRAKSPEGVRYLVLRLGDGTFVHFSTVDTEDGVSPIPGLEAFRPFQSGIKERCIEPPGSSDVTIVGNYRMLGE